MTVPAATMTFSVGEDSVSVPAPMAGYQGTHERAQAVGKSATGVVYVYDKDVTSRAARPVLRLTKTQRDNLITWFDTHAQGALNTFTWVDHLGATHSTCRLRSPIAWRKTAGGVFEVQLDIITADDVG